MQDQYYCPLCMREEKDVYRGCPECKLIQTIEMYKRSVIENALKRQVIFSAFSFKDLEGYYNLVSKYVDKELPDHFPALFTGLVEIINAEEMRVENIKKKIADTVAANNQPPKGSQKGIRPKG